ncbi:GAF domain-containing sensor histidine kinase [Lentzea sp. NPDC004782]|uniref:GAF domain-containing sensor histidine kinase n=1 Tax=Lentzea sp. NPDC004782 TaxID=3154458 RepID=UPI0033B2A496
METVHQIFVEEAGVTEHGRKPDPPSSPADPLRLPGTARTERLWALLRAGHLVASHVELPVVLRHIVDAAKDLVDARYAALGVLGPDKVVQEFVHSGADDDAALEIGHPPHGEGILGLLITEPRPIRLADLTSHPASAGFPPGHPPMRSFLGVPILIRGQAFGNLYLAEKTGGHEFSAEDEALVESLAGFAAVAVDNARLYAEAQRRAAWQHASVEITAALLAGTDTDDVLHLIADHARTVADADIAAVIVPTHDPAVLSVRAAAGQHAGELLGQEMPAAESLSGLTMSSAQPLLSDNIAADARRHVPDAPWSAHLGAGMTAPLVAPGETPTGVLIVANRPGGRGFDQRDLDLLASFASQAALAQRLALHRADAETLQLLEDRDRIGRDLHDHVIQELFAAGLSLHSVATTATTDQRRRLLTVVGKLDKVVGDIRTTIFNLQTPRTADEPPSLRLQLTDVIHDATEPLGFTPALRFDGPLDTLVPDDIAADLIAVVREALSNTARHARATTATVDISATPDAVTARIEDDGRGIGDTTRRSGLANLRTRAEKHGGTLTTDSVPPRGTTLIWRVPLSP